MINKTFSLTLFALFAFAANSVFCRLALGEEQIDAGSFTVIRLLSGIVFLALFIVVKQVYFSGGALVKNNIDKVIVSDKKSHNETPSQTTPMSKGSWLSALWLFIYALTFSYAYIQLDTATGALVLFATVQVTMLLIGLLKGRTLSQAELLGLLLAVAGFVYLLAPQMSSPSLIAFILMMVAGITWALYTLAGKNSTNPSYDTAFNFFRTIPFVVVFALWNMDVSYLTTAGVINAVLSGVFASALGYLLWYQALKTLRHNVAAVVQLLVPVLAALAGFMLLDESVSIEFIISSSMILGGILLVVKNPNIKIFRKKN